MGDAKSSMFYAFALFLLIYLVGVGIYSIVQMVKKRMRRHKDERM